jgi:hypothetical protein
MGYRRPKWSRASHGSCRASHVKQETRPLALPAGPQFQSSLRIRLQLAWKRDPDHGYPAEGALRLNRCRNKYVYVPVLSADHIMQFKFDAATGMLTPNDPPVVDIRAGAGPRHLTIHPNGKWGLI